MVRRYYSSNARETQLTGAVNSSATSITVDSPVGYPASTPFLIHVELGTSNEEIMLVTNVAGSTYTVTRGYDSSTAVSHSTGARVVHGVAGIDFTDFADHIDATTNVHGLSGGAALVGSTTTQTLTNKTLTSPTINGGTWNSPTLGSGATIPSATLSSPTITTPSITNPTITSGGSWAGSPTISTPTITTPVIANLSSMQHTHTDAASGGAISSGGSTVAIFGERTTSQTLTSSTFATLGGGTINYTSPSAWPTGTTKLVMNMTVYSVAYDGSPAGLKRLYARFVTDGSTNYPHANGADMYVVADSSIGQFWSFTYSWVAPLPSTSASHSLAGQLYLSGINGSVSASQVWAYPI